MAYGANLPVVQGGVGEYDLTGTGPYIIGLIPAASFTAGHRYLFFISCYVSASNDTRRPYIAPMDVASDVLMFTAAQEVAVNRSTVNPHGRGRWWQWAGFMTPDGAHDLRVLVQDTYSSGDAYFSQIRAVGIDLEAVDRDDWFFGFQGDAGFGYHNTASVGIANNTYTDNVGANTWLNLDPYEYEPIEDGISNFPNGEPLLLISNSSAYIWGGSAHAHTRYKCGARIVADTGVVLSTNEEVADFDGTSNIRINLFNIGLTYNYGYSTRGFQVEHIGDDVFEMQVSSLYFVRLQKFNRSAWYNPWGYTYDSSGLSGFPTAGGSYANAYLDHLTGSYQFPYNDDVTSRDRLLVFSIESKENSGLAPNDDDEISLVRYNWTTFLFDSVVQTRNTNDEHRYTALDPLQLRKAMIPALDNTADAKNFSWYLNIYGDAVYSGAQYQMQAFYLFPTFNPVWFQTDMDVLAARTWLKTPDLDVLKAATTELSATLEVMRAQELSRLSSLGMVIAETKTKTSTLGMAIAETKLRTSTLSVSIEGGVQFDVLLRMAIADTYDVGALLDSAVAATYDVSSSLDLMITDRVFIVIEPDRPTLPPTVEVSDLQTALTPNSVRSPSTDFEAAGISIGDALDIKDGPNKGHYVIRIVDGHVLITEEALPSSDNGPATAEVRRQQEVTAYYTAAAVLDQPQFNAGFSRSVSLSILIQ